MRRALSWMSVFILIPLVACSFAANTGQPKSPAITPTKSGEQVQTEMSQLLTLMPTGTGQPAAAAQSTATQILPTLAVETATPAPTAGNAASGQVATATAAPTAAPVATATPQPQPTATQQSAAASAATATLANTLAPSATTIPGDRPDWLAQAAKVTDDMRGPQTWNWPTGSDDFTEAFFNGNQQLVRALTTKDGWRLANPPGRNFATTSNIYLEANFNIKACHKDSAPMADHYGLIVRVPDLVQPIEGYLLGFNCNGDYSLRSWVWNGDDARRQDMTMLINWTHSDFIKGGPNQTNVMGIETSDNVLHLYANGHYLASFDYFDHKVVGGTPVPQLPTGYFGVFVGSRTNVDARTSDDFTIGVDEMSYWVHP